MAGRFPIYHTEKTMPGKVGAVTGQVKFDTGAGEFARAVGQVGQQMWQVQAQTEFAAATMKYRREANALEVRLESIGDETEYQEESQKFFDTVQDFEIKNGLAARKFQDFLALALPETENYIARKTQQRIKENWWSGLFEAEAEAERTGVLSGAENYMRLGEQAGMIDDATMTQSLTELRHKAERHRAGSMAMNDPEAFEKLIHGDKIDGFVTFDHGDVQDMRSIMQGQKTYNQHREELANDSLYQQVTQMALEDKSYQEVKNTILPRTDVTPIQKTKILNTFLNAQKMMQDGGPNPWTATQDYAALTKLVRKIEDPTVKVSLSDLHEAWLKGDRPNWSFDHQQMLKNMLEERSRPTAENAETTQRLKELTNLIEASAGRMGATVASMEVTQVAQIKARDLLTERIRQSKEKGEPLRGIDLQRAMLETHRLIRTELEQATPMEMILPSESEWERYEKTGGMELEGRTAYFQQAQKPASKQIFYERIGRMKGQGKTKEAAEYYDRWRDYFD